MNDQNHKQRYVAARQFMESLDQLEQRLAHDADFSEPNLGQPSLNDPPLTSVNRPPSRRMQTAPPCRSALDSPDDSISAFEAAAADIEQFIQAQRLES